MNAPLTPERKQKIREYIGKATPPPWAHDVYGGDCMFVFGPNVEMIMSRTAEGFAQIRGCGAKLPMNENGEFIASARTDLPDLLESHEALVAALRGEIGMWSKISPSCQYPHVDPCMCDKHSRERSVAALLNAGVEL